MDNLPKMSKYAKFCEETYLRTRLGIVLTHQSDIFLATFIVSSHCKYLTVIQKSSHKYLGAISLIITLYHVIQPIKYKKGLWVFLVPLPQSSALKWKFYIQSHFYFQIFLFWCLFLTSNKFQFLFLVFLMLTRYKSAGVHRRCSKNFLKIWETHKGGMKVPNTNPQLYCYVFVSIVSSKSQLQLGKSGSVSRLFQRCHWEKLILLKKLKETSH